MLRGIENESRDIFGNWDDEFFLEIGSGYTPATVESLEVACRAYFETYQATKGLILAAPMDYHTAFRYIQLSRQAVLYFHHFFELAIKDVLRLEHPLLASRLEEAKGEQLLLILRNDMNNEKSLKSVEFGEALRRLSMGVKVVGSILEKYQFISQKFELLNNLNSLRNRIWHRGKIFPPRPALDKLVGSQLLPLALKILDHPPFEGLPNRLRVKPGKLASSPIEELCLLWKSNQEPPEWKVQLVKEMGRTALNAQDRFLKPGYQDEKARGRLKRIAETHIESGEYGEYGAGLKDESPGVRLCSACGFLGLITTVESEWEHEVSGCEYDGETVVHVEVDSYPIWAKCIEVECINCRLSLHALDFPETESWLGFDFSKLFWEK